MSLSRSITTPVVAIIAILAGLLGVVQTTNYRLSAAEIVHALSFANVLDESNKITQTSSNTNSAAVTTVNGTMINVPKSGNRAINMTNGTVSLAITPPRTSTTGANVANGVVSYGADNGTV